MPDKQADLANKFLAVGTIKQQITFLQKKVRVNEIDAAVRGHRHLSIFQMLP